MTDARCDNKKADLKIGFFITGTDTDVGKTFVSACICETARDLGIKVAPRKPIASGCILQEGDHLLSEDAQVLQQAAGNLEDHDTICRYRYTPAISPHQALIQAGVEVSTQQLIDACETPKDFMPLIEGAGGWYSPLSSDGLNADLAKQLQLPVILVAANRLGCINQILLSQEAILQSGLELKAIILNQVVQGKNYAANIEQYLKAPLISVAHNKNGQPLPLEQLTALFN